MPAGLRDRIAELPSADELEDPMIRPSSKKGDDEASA